MTTPLEVPRAAAPGAASGFYRMLIAALVLAGIGLVNRAPREG